jgi:hypothetical protein
MGTAVPLLPPRFIFKKYFFLMPTIDWVDAIGATAD